MFGELHGSAQQFAEQFAALGIAVGDLTSAELARLTELDKRADAEYEASNKVATADEQLAASLNELKMGVLATNEEQLNLIANMPSFEEALGELSGEAERFAREAAALGLKWSDFDAETQAAWQQLNERGQAEDALTTSLKQLKTTVLATNEEQLNLTANLPSFKEALGEMSGEAEVLARQAAALGLTWSDLDAETQAAWIAIDARADKDRDAAAATEEFEVAIRKAASELQNVQGLSAGYKFDEGGKVTGRLTLVDRLRMEIEGYKEIYGGAQYDVDRLQKKLEEGKMKPHHRFTKGEFAGFTLQEALDFSKERLEAEAVYRYEKQLEDDAIADQLKREQEAADAEEAARLAEEQRLFRQVQDIRYERGDISQPDYLRILEERLTEAEQKYGRFSPEEHAIWSRIQEILEEIRDNTSGLEDFLDELLGVRITERTAPFDRSLQSRAGTETVTLDRLEQLIRTATRN